MAQEQRELNTLEDAVDLLDEWVDHSAQLKLKHDQKCSEMLETMGTAQSLLDEYRAYAWSCARSSSKPTPSSPSAASASPS
jgi:DNA uptake protein ComE-like DNA-binding protein